MLWGAEWFPDEPGGLNRYFRDLLTALSANGSQPRALVLGPASDPPPGLTVVDRGPLPLRLLRYGRAARRLSDAAELVDSHFALYGIAALLAGAARGSPLVIHFQGPWAAESRSRGGPRWKGVVKRDLEGLLYRRATLAVTLSGSFKRLLVERYGVDPWRVLVVPPAVDLDRFVQGEMHAARDLLGLPSTGQVAVSVRRLVPRMGLETLIRAWASLGPGPERTLLVVGDGPGRGSLERLAEELGVGGTVRFAGAVGDAELVACYQAADVSVVPTIELEGFGLVVLESLACGTPVITSDATGLREATSGLKHRVVTPAGDPGRLGEALGKVLAGELSVPSSDECRAYAERFSFDALARRHRELYRRALTSPSSGKLRVVFLDHCARLSGAEISLLHIVGALDGVDAHVILGEPGPLEARLREQGISTEVLPLGAAAQAVRRNRVRPGLGAVSAAVYAARLARRLRRLKPDLVHVNTLKSGVYGAPAARLAGIPVVWHLHDRLADDYMSGRAARMVRTASSLFAEQVIANSRATLATVGERARDKATVVPNPVEPPTSPALIRDEVTRVGMLGRIAPWKGQDVFLEAFARAFPSPGVEAVLIGAPLFGEDAFLESLRRRTRELGIDRRVTFRGFVEDVSAELGELDLLVHASTIPEPFGQAVLEGMAAGLPVVASDAGGPAEIVRDGVDGLLYPPGDAPALAERLRRLAGDRSLRARLGEAARRSAGEFSPERVAEMVEEVYTRVIDRRRA